MVGENVPVGDREGGSVSSSPSEPPKKMFSVGSDVGKGEGAAVESSPSEPLNIPLVGGLVPLGSAVVGLTVDTTGCPVGTTGCSVEGRSVGAEDGMAVVGVIVLGR